MDPVRVLNFSNTLINGLAFLQILGVCHRDLKPENILLDKSKENLVLIDFGAAKNIISQQTKMTVTIVGTKSYTSPEMLEGFARPKGQIKIGGLEINDKGTCFLGMNPYKSDVFSLGLIIMEMWRSRTKNVLPQKEYDIKIEEGEKEIVKMMGTEEEKKKFKNLAKILRNCLKVEPDERWDFLRIFKENIDSKDCKKMRLHMMITLCSDEAIIEEFFKNCNNECCYEFIIKLKNREGL